MSEALQNARTAIEGCTNATRSLIAAEAECERLRGVLEAYRNARRWATGTEQHRLALEVADALNPTGEK